MKSKEQLRKVFENGDKPTQDDFWDWQESYWHKEELIPKDSVEGLNECFFQEGKETLTVLEQPTLTGNMLTLNYVGENGVTQSVNVDLSSLHTLDVNVSGATFNASNNIITLTETDGESFQIDLSQLQIIATTDSNGTTTVSQEGSNKLTISKAGQSGNYSDLSGLPDLTAFVTLSNLNSKADKSIQINTTTPLQGGGDLSGNRTISIQQANSLQNGYLSNTDWNTFNNKMTAPTMTNNNVGRWDDTNKKFIDGVIQDDGTKILIGNSTSSNNISESRIKIKPFNFKFFNLGGLNDLSMWLDNGSSSSTLPTNLYSGDIYNHNKHIWLRGGAGTNVSNNASQIVKDKKFTGLNSDYYLSNSPLTETLNIDSYRNGDLYAINTGYCYGNTVNVNYTGVTGADSRMYEGGIIMFDSGYNKSYLAFDIKGNAFFKGTGTQSESDWKKALTDNQNKTTTLGSETNYTNIKWAVDSTTKAALIAPRMTQAQRLTISLPQNDEKYKGAIIYQTDGSAGYYLWNGSSWQILDSNIANNDLTNTTARTFTQNASFTWDTLGNPYYLKGLADKTSDISNFNKVLKLNPTTKEIAFGDSLTVQQPSTMAVTVNHVYPNSIQDMATFPTGIQNLMANLASKTFTPILQPDWNIVQNATSPGTYDYNSNALKLIGVVGTGTSINAISTKILPRNKEWIVKCALQIPGIYNNASEFGITQTSNVNGIVPSKLLKVKFSSESGTNGQIDLTGYDTSNIDAWEPRWGNNDRYGYLIIAHSNDVIYAIYMKGSTIFTKTIGNFDTIGDYRLEQTILAGNASLISSVEYYIQP